MNKDPCAWDPAIHVGDGIKFQDPEAWLALAILAHKPGDGVSLSLSLSVKINEQISFNRVSFLPHRLQHSYFMAFHLQN